MTVFPETNSPHRLSAAAGGLVVITLATAAIVGRLTSPLGSLLAVLGVYWAGCWLLVLRASSRRSLGSLFRKPLNRRPVELALTWLPAALTLVIVFVAAAPALSPTVLGAIGLVAVINGTTEETFWRGAFVATFPERSGWAYLYPSFLFAALHVAFALLPGIRYQGGVLALIGGGAVMGLGWGFVVWSTRDLRSVIAAHVLTNFFAFSGLVLANWP